MREVLLARREWTEANSVLSHIEDHVEGLDEHVTEDHTKAVYVCEKVVGQLLKSIAIKTYPFLECPSNSIQGRQLLAKGNRMEKLLKGSSRSKCKHRK